MDPISPWHMWGTSQRVQLVGELTAVSNQPAKNSQLARVNFRRPETWSFFLSASISATPAASVSSDLDVSFGIIIGVGRSNVYVPKFVSFHFVVPANAAVPPPPYEAQKWAMSATSPPFDDSSPTVLATGLQFPAQDIQCYANSSYSGTGASGLIADVTLSAFFAPATHVRPDWFNEEGLQFLGGETGGT